MLSRLKKLFDGARHRWNTVSHVLDAGLHARPGTVRSRWVLFIAEVIRQVRRDDVSLMSAGVAYYAVLSVLPLGVALSGVLGLFADSETVQRAVESFFAVYVPAASDDFLDQLGGRSAAANSLSAAIGLIGLLWTGTAMLSALAKAINRAHGIQQDRPFYLGRPRALLLGATVFIAFGISVYSSAAITAASQFNVPLIGELTALQWAARVPSLLLTFTTFALTYQLLPNKRTRWRNSLPAAALAATAF